MKFRVSHLYICLVKTSNTDSTRYLQRKKQFCLMSIVISSIFFTFISCFAPKIHLMSGKLNYYIRISFIGKNCMSLCHCTVFHTTQTHLPQSPPKTPRLNVEPKNYRIIYKQNTHMKMNTVKK